MYTTEVLLEKANEILKAKGRGAYVDLAPIAQSEAKLTLVSRKGADPALFYIPMAYAQTMLYCLYIGMLMNGENVSGS